jgi:hypothetical protein
MPSASPHQDIVPSAEAGQGWPDRAALARLMALAARLTRMVAVARALVAADRIVDLAGFEDGVGLLCAKALDLDRPCSRQMVPVMLELLAQIDGLSLKIGETRHRRAAVAPVEH